MSDHGSVTRRGVVTAASAAAAATLAGGAAAVAPAAVAPAGPDGFSARQFGAVGDGIADDTDALQAALDAAFAASDSAPGALVIPPGTYKVTRGLRFTQRENCGQERRISAYGACLQSAIVDGSHVLHIRSTVYWHFMIIEGLEIAGTGQDGHGVFLDCDHAVHSLYNSCLRDVVVRGCGGDGCRIYGNIFESQLINCCFRDNRNNGATLAHSPHGGVLSSLHLFGCSFDDNDEHGVEIVRSYDVGFHGCSFRRNGRFGLFASNGCELVLDCAFEDNHRLAYDFANGAAGMALRRYATLIGCTSHSTAHQTCLIDADLTGSFARLVMLGCRGSGRGPAAAAGLARLRGSRKVDATIIGCQGSVTCDGFEPLAIGGPGDGIRFASDWRGPNLFQLGEHRLWIDDQGRLRMKHGAPRAADDGKPVGG